MSSPQPGRRFATLVAFVHCLEPTAQDEVLEVLEMLFHDLFGKAITADQKVRLRTLKDLDESAVRLGRSLSSATGPRAAAPAANWVVKMVATGKRTAADAARLFNVHRATISRLLARAGGEVAVGKK